MTAACSNVDACSPHVSSSAEGSDLHLKVPAPPLIRVHGQLSRSPGCRAARRPRTPRRRSSTMLRDETRSSRSSPTEREVDFSYARPGRRPLPRQRLPPARRRSRSSAARSRTRSSRSSELSLPAVISRARRGGARDHPGHRHDRLGQVDDARGDDRPHQPSARASTSSRSRTRSSSSTATSARSSTSARSARTPRPSSARCAACCARTPT